MGTSFDIILIQPVLIFLCDNSHIHCLRWVKLLFFPSPHSEDIPVFTINLLGVRVFGELEFWFSSIKSTCWQIDSIACVEISSVLALIGLLLMGIIIDLGELDQFMISSNWSSCCRWKSRARSYWVPILAPSRWTDGYIPSRPSPQYQTFYFPRILGDVNQCPVRLHRNGADWGMSNSWVQSCVLTAQR
jgi:hypothetical protein